MANIFTWDFLYEEVTSMRIEKITVHGFRNIKNTELRLDNILALVSLNSYGKSNLLTAIDFGTNFITVSKNAKKKMMHLITGVPLNKKLAEEDFKFELEMTTMIDSNKYWVLYGYQFSWLKNDQPGHIVGEWLKIKKEEKGQKYSSYIIRENGRANYKKAETGRCDYQISVESNELIINKLEALDNLFFLDIVKKINMLSTYIERHFDADSAYQYGLLIRTDWDDSDVENINDLPRAIYSLKVREPDKYELLINSYKLLFPQIAEIEVRQASIDREFKVSIPEDVPFRIANEIYVLRVIDKNLNQDIDFEYMSDGAKRILLLLTCIIYADIKKISLVAIEEPDNCIHPSLLRSLLIIITQLTENCRILITSHSPYLIQFLEPSNLYVGVPSNDGVAHFSSIRSSCQKALIRNASEARMNTGDYIFDLISGSEEDINELNQYLECDSE